MFRCGSHHCQLLRDYEKLLEYIAKKMQHN